MAMARAEVSGDHQWIHVDIEQFPLDRALDAYDRMRAGTLRGRAVITP